MTSVCAIRCVCSCVFRVCSFLDACVMCRLFLWPACPHREPRLRQTVCFVFFRPLFAFLFCSRFRSFAGVVVVRNNDNDVCVNDYNR